MAKKKKKGDNRPLVLQKKPNRVSLIKIEKLAVEIHHLIQLIHLSPNPILDITKEKIVSVDMVKHFLNIQF